MESYKNPFQVRWLVVCKTGKHKLPDKLASLLDSLNKKKVNDF